MSMTLTRSYNRYGDAKAAVHDLKAAGIAEGEISLIANKEDDGIGDGIATGAGVGAAGGAGIGLLTGVGLMAIPGVGPVVAVGWLAAAAVGAVAGAAAGAAAGGMIDAMVGSGIPEKDAHVYAESVRRGAALVSVRVSDVNQTEAAAILDRHKPIDVVSRRRELESGGWSAFDSEGRPYSREQLDAERKGNL
jgi:hypothetical protein